MINEYINFPVGTCFKEVYEGKPYFYILGEFFIYCNDFHNPQHRPWKIDISKLVVANEDEKNQFIKDLKKNHLIWNEETGKLEREFEEIRLSVKIKAKPGIDINKLIETLNLKVENPFGVYNMKFEDF
jgi:hypothetical protein